MAYYVVNTDTYNQQYSNDAWVTTWTQSVVNPYINPLIIRIFSLPQIVTSYTTKFGTISQFTWNKNYPSNVQ